MAGTAAARRRYRRRRRVVVAATVVVVVAAGAGTAYALDGSDGPRYRFATAARGTVTQTVDADGSLAAEQVVTPAFASAGTVTGVGVAVGDTVTAGQTLATIGTSGLTEAVTSAETALAQAQEKLTDAEDGTSATSTTGNGTGGSGTSTGSGTGTTAGTTATTTSATTGTRTASSAGATLLSDTTPATTSATTSGAASTTGTLTTGTPTTGTTSGSTKTGTATDTASVEALRATVATDAAALVAAVHAQTSAIATACAPATEKDGSVVTASPAADGSISGAVGSQAALVTLEQDGTVLHTANAGSPVAAGDGYSFTGLTAGATYTVRIVRMAVVDTATCTTAVTDAQATDSSVATASATFSRDLAALQKALATAGTGSAGGAGSGGTGSGAGTGGTSGGTRSGTTGSSQTGNTQTGGAQSAGTRSGTQSTGTTTTTVTAEQIVADQAAVTAAQADVTLAKKNLGNATLTSPITGTVAAVGIAKGDTVGTSSSTQTITVIGHDALSVELDIPLTKIDLVKAGQTASVTVDGLTTPVAAKVTYVGSLNSASSTGSSSSYPVTVQLEKVSSTLYDGMGAEVSIAVGSGTSAVTVPLSAVTTVGKRSVVSVYSGGKVTATSVTLGLVGTDTVQVTKGLTAGQRIVLADLDAAVPSSTTTTTRRGTGTGTFGGLTGGTGTGTFGGGAGGGFGGPPGGR